MRGKEPRTRGNNYLGGVAATSRKNAIDKLLVTGWTLCTEDLSRVVPVRRLYSA